jgi:hypothetical protein
MTIDAAEYSSIVANESWRTLFGAARRGDEELNATL